MSRGGIVVALAFALVLGPGCAACCTDQYADADAAGSGGGGSGLGSLNFGGGGAGGAVALVVIGGILTVALLATLTVAAVEAATPDDFACDGRCCTGDHAAGYHGGCHCSEKCPCWGPAIRR